MLSPETLDATPVHHSIRVPFTAELSGGLAGGWITVANAADTDQTGTIELVRSEDGAELAVQTLQLQPGEVGSIALADLVASAGPSLGAEGRVIVRGQESGLLATGTAIHFATNAEQELHLFARKDAHSQGSYPIPDPATFRTRTTLVNVSDEESRIVGQLSWEGGTYAYGPLEVPARSTRVVDFNRLAALGEYDLDDRKIPRSFSQGFFHWTVQAGSRELVARTEVMPKGTAEAYGFNCTGCCMEMSFGALEPGTTTFPVGANGALEGVEFIDTCTGTMGPFTPVNPDWGFAAPLSWNGQSVTASGPDSQDLDMTATGHRTALLTCEEKTITIFANGPATALEVTVLDVSLPANEIQVRLEPPNQSGQLKVRLAGPSQKVLVDETRSSGLHTFTFGNLSSYMAGQEFDRVVAEWTVNGKTETGSKSYGFKALGSYNHTQYNTPVSSQSCSGSLVGFCYFTGDCVNVQSCTSHQTAQAPSEWVTEVEENGGGKHAQIGFVTREEFCSHPGTCGHTFRRVNAPCPSCSGLSVQAGQTVAVSKTNRDLPCGSRVVVEGITRALTVADHGGGLSLTQLDHYIGTGGCNQAGTIGQRATFLLQ